MGREVKRVPVHFNWPTNKVWEGFINPHRGPPKCNKCDGRGYSWLAKQLHDRWYGYVEFKPDDRGSTPFTVDDDHVKAWAHRQCSRSPEFYGSGPGAERREAERIIRIWNSSWSHHLNDDDVAALIEGGRLMDLTHTWTKGPGWQPKSPPYIPTAREVNVWSCGGFGHDSINNWIVIKAECARQGVASECDSCGGDGYKWNAGNTVSRERYENWQSYEPPEGDGWQLWETVSEGSPISPVFATAQGLAEHMAREGDPVHGKGMTAQQWLKWITDSGWAPSMIGDAKGLLGGVEAMADPSQ